MAALVSIITPLYNGKRFVAQTIESVLAQTFQDWEMIVVNDGSKDGCEKIVENYAQKDPRIKLFNKENGGSASARNYGIKQASGRYFAFLDSDDLWEPHFLESQLNFMQQTGGKLVCSAHKRIDEENKECLKPFYPPQKATYTDQLKTCSISCLTVLYDSEPYGKFYFREDLGSLRDDYALWLEIIKKVGVVYGNQEILGSYRILSNQVTAKKYKMIKPQYGIYRKVEKLGVFRSLYYLCWWGVKGLIKYRK